METSPTVAILATLDSKSQETWRACAGVRSAGARPWVLDLSLRPHAVAGADVTAERVAEAGGSDLISVAALDRGEAAAVMVTGARQLVSDGVERGHLHAAMGLGGANGTWMACAIMRELPLLFPKLMVSAVAATPAAPWYIGASDIILVPSVGDLGVNRVTTAIIRNASVAAVAMARSRLEQPEEDAGSAPVLVGVSSFGGTAACVARVQEGLEAAGYEVILFHASGSGGRALERMALAGQLGGVIDVTTHELTDLVVGGVYSAGDDRLRGAATRGIPQVVVPGALDHANLWVGEVPERFRGREFVRYNQQNLLMRTDAGEYEAVATLMADRLEGASGPVAVLIPRHGFSEHTRRRTVDLDGEPVGVWQRPEVDARFGEVLGERLGDGVLREFDLHINDPEFADACVTTFLDLVARSAEMDDAGEATR
ncbi:MAG: Tm-1-like ATP-binding domain-containing protein [Nitriliruptoraceae bacterium]